MFLALKMHHLQPKQSITKAVEAKELMKKYNVSATQLPSIKAADKGLPEGAKVGDIIKIERKDDKGEKFLYYRIVVQ